MIIINAGLPKSGTTLIQQYQIDLITFAGKRNGQNELFKYGYNIHEFSEQSNRGFFVDIGDTEFKLLEEISRDFGDIVVKTHCIPNEYIEKILLQQLGKATFCYRDPRDIILSAIDHGKRTREGLDRSGAYHDLFDIDQGIIRIKKWFNMFVEWKKIENVLFIKYEELIQDKIGIINALMRYFHLDLSEASLYSIYEKHEKLKISAWNFNVGKCFRWRDEMDSNQISKCNHLLKEEIIQLGYSLS